MEDDNIQNSLSSKPFLPLAVGLIGVVLGVAGLIIAINTARRASAIEEAYKGGLEKTAVAAIELERISHNIQALEANIKDAREVPAQLERLRSETQTAFSGLQSYIKENRAAIVKNSNAIVELASRQTSPTSVAPQGAGSSQGTTTTDTASDASASKKHTVKAGENFSVIAKKYGKSVADIEKANPGVKSVNLRIDQQINIP